MAGGIEVSREPSEVAPRSATPPPTHYRTDIQGLRAVAVIAVVLFHVRELLPGGFVGVDVFFVISGFVITRSVVRETDRTGRLSLADFFSRRVRRLLPALAVVLTVTTLISVVALSTLGPAQSAAKTARAAALSVANLQLLRGPGYFDPAAESNPLLHTWSLSVEEQFYLAFAVGVGAVFFFARWSGRKVLRISILAAMAASFLLNVLLTAGPIGINGAERIAFFTPFTRAWEFLAGAALALIPLKLSTGLIRQLVPIAGAAILLYTFVTYNAEMTFPGFAALAPVIATVMIISATTGSAIGRLLSVRPVVAIGDISYSLYLWHWPFIVFAEAVAPALIPLAVAASFVAAWFSYRYLETSISRDRRFAGRRAVSLGVVCVAVPVVVATLVLSLLNNGLGAPGSDELVERTAARQRGCHTEGTQPIADLETCTWKLESARGSVLLVGDSHAISVADSALDAAVLTDLDFTALTRSACPFIARSVANDGCSRYQDDIFRLVEELRPDALLVVNFSPRQAGADGEVEIRDADGRSIESPELGVEEWEAGMREMVARVAPFVRKVIILDPTPTFESKASTTVTLLTPDGRPEDRPLREVLERNSGTSAAHRAVADELAVATVVDPLPVLCSATSCPQAEGGTWLYYDDHHLTTVGAARLEGLFADAFRSSQL